MSDHCISELLRGPESGHNRVLNLIIRDNRFATDPIRRAIAEGSSELVRGDLRGHQIVEVGNQAESRVAPDLP